jgi:hypothetical protein
MICGLFGTTYVCQLKEDLIISIQLFMILVMVQDYPCQVIRKKDRNIYPLFLPVRLTVLKSSSENGILTLNPLLYA